MQKPKFRCSGLGHLMTNPKSKKLYFISEVEVDAKKFNKYMDKAIESNDFTLLSNLRTETVEVDSGELSDGSKVHCVDVWTAWKYKRHEELYSKYIEKGNALEEDAITLVSVQTGIFHKKNEETLSNEWISGTPDLFIGESIQNADFIEDTKCSWDVFTFNRTKHKKLNDLYYWQMQGYMMLTGAKEARLRYCLLNATDDLIRDELRKLGYAMRLIDFEETPEFEKRAAMVERNMIYDLPAFIKRYPNFDLHLNVKEWVYDIPKEERLYTVVIPRNDADIELIKHKVQKAWEFMENL